jgi:hypothetical protein
MKVRMDLVENHCWCAHCIERHPERAGWGKKV